ncbi:MAG TPA: hypothetical protein VGB73_03975 [Pyrinomonadaceae bacterium]|jgi:hypothetical protein
MNDYLWDKSGDADEDVRQLEELLGTLRHQPRPLELPEEFQTANPLRPLRRTRRFWPALAAAAALLLVALAGLRSVDLNTGEAALNSPESAATKPERQQEALQATRLAASASVAGETSTPQRSRDAGAVAIAAPVRRASTPSLTSAHAGKRRGRREKALDESLALGSRQLARGRATPDASPKQVQKDSVESLNPVAAVDAREQQFAKEQLMLALRVTSSKLSIVQRKTRGTNEVKAAPDEQQKLR